MFTTSKSKCLFVITIIGASFWIGLIWNEYQLSESIISIKLLSILDRRNQSDAQIDGDKVHNVNNQYYQLWDNNIMDNFAVGADFPMMLDQTVFKYFTKYERVNPMGYLLELKQIITLSIYHDTKDPVMFESMVWIEKYQIYLSVTRDRVKAKGTCCLSQLLLAKYDKNWNKLGKDIVFSVTNLTELIAIRDKYNMKWIGEIMNEDPRLMLFNDDIIMSFHGVNYDIKNDTKSRNQKIWIGLANISSMLTISHDDIHDDIQINIETGIRGKNWEWCMYKGISTNVWQKNWSILEYKQTLYMITDIEPLKVLKCDNLCFSECQLIFNEDKTNRQLSNIRGGSAWIKIPFDYHHNNNNGYRYYISLLHSAERQPKRLYRGHICILRIDTELLDTMDVMEEPIFRDLALKTRYSTLFKIIHVSSELVFKYKNELIVFDRNESVNIEVASPVGMLINWNKDIQHITWTINDKIVLLTTISGLKKYIENGFTNGGFNALEPATNFGLSVKNSLHRK